MKNLKRILSLALASVMVMGMMVVGASAYADQDQIDSDHANAVAILDALNIMNGNPDGTFNPKGELTRGEMATMIATLLNRGTAPNYGTKPTPSFGDIDGHWAEPFIEYVTSVKVNGISAMNGVGGGRFDPDAPLTATTAARTILNAMGYTIDDPSNWALLTEVQARQEGIDLYKGLDAIEDPSNDHITREQMAEMFNTALNAPVADNGERVWVWQVANIDFPTFSDANAYAAAIAGEDGTPEVPQRVLSSTADKLGVKYLGLTNSPVLVETVTYNRTTGYRINATNYYTDTDVSQYMGQMVTVLSKGSGENTTVYGVVPTGTVLYSGVVGDITADDGTKKLTIDGTEYEYATNGNKITTWNSSDAAAEWNTVNDWNTLTVIDNNNDGKIDRMISKPVVVSQVTRVAKDGKVTVADVNKNSDGTAQPIDPAKNNVATGLKQDDFVVSTSDIKGVWTVEKASTVKNVRFTRKTTDAFIIGGVSYKDSGTIMDGKTVGAQPYDLVVYGGYLFSCENAAGESSTANLADVVYVLDSAAVVESGDFSEKTYTAKVMIQKQDNSKETITIGSAEGTAYAAANSTSVAKDKLYIMTTDEDGVIDLTAVTADNVDLTAGTAPGNVAIADGKLGTTRIADNAVIFMKVGTTVKCLDGKTVAGWKLAAAADSNANFDSTKSVAFTDTASDGFTYLTLANLIAKDLTVWPDAVSEMEYGYITADASTEYLTTDDGVATAGTYYRVKLWNGTEEKEYVTKTDITSWAKAGAFAKFEVGTGITLVSITELDATPDAVVAWNGAEYETENGITANVNDAKSIVIYIDDEKHTSADEVGIARADASTEEGVDWVQNVYTAVGNGSEKILFVDVNNEIHPATEDAGD